MHKLSVFLDTIIFEKQNLPDFSIEIFHTFPHIVQLVPTLFSLSLTHCSDHWDLMKALSGNKKIREQEYIYIEKLLYIQLENSPFKQIFAPTGVIFLVSVDLENWKETKKKRIPYLWKKKKLSSDFSLLLCLLPLPFFCGALLCLLYLLLQS